MNKSGAVILISILISMVFVSSIVSAQFGEGSQMPQWLSDGYNKWKTGTLDNNSAPMAKVLVFILIAIVILLAIQTIIPGNWWAYPLAIIVAILGTFTIKPAEIFSLLISYNALAMTITTLIPFIMLFGLTYRAATAEGSSKVQLQLLQWFAWLTFTAYMVYKVIDAWISTEVYSTGVAVVLFLITGVAAVLFVFNKKAFRFIRKEFLSAENESAKSTLSNAANAAKNLDKFQRDVAADKEINPYG